MRSGETCMLQSAMQMFVARFPSRPAGCSHWQQCLSEQAAGLSATAAKNAAFGRDDTV
jgi:hypothetical protein